MGFHREGNKRGAEIGRIIELREFFKENGYVWEIEDNSGAFQTNSEHKVETARKRSNSSVRKITDESELNFSLEGPPEKDL